MVSLCLNMIVKNESGRIERALASVSPWIKNYVIADTGSTDDTKKKIAKFFENTSIKGKIVDIPFKNWAQARNGALAAARASAEEFGFTHILLTDADMELRVTDAKKWFEMMEGRNGIDMFQCAGSLQYINKRVISTAATGKYLGVTHEYLDVPPDCNIPMEVANFYDHADGSNRPEKYKRDIKLLKEGIKEEPNNVRYMFYLAQSYRDAGKPEKALKWYNRRIDAGGWDEEIWNSMVNIAHCYKDMGDEDQYILNLLKAYNYRPQRAETLYDLAHYYRCRGKSEPLGALFAKIGMEIPKSTDGLFVQDYVYAVGCKEEFAICAFYNPLTRDEGFVVNDTLSMIKSPYGGSRELARNNMFYYLRPLQDILPSFKWTRINFNPPVNWAAMNPSIINVNNKLRCIVRTVNYRIDDNGRYVIYDVPDTGQPGTNANDSNPINTRNYLVDFDDEFNVLDYEEIKPPADMPPPQFKAVIGFEDMRLFMHNGHLMTHSCVREMNAQGVCEQVLGKLIEDGKGVHVADLHTMIYKPGSYEKNWMAITHDFEDGPRFVYRLGEIINRDAKTVQKRELPVDVGNVSGSTQFIPFDNGFLGLTHEARPLPGTPHKRYYYHRFVWLNEAFNVEKITRPFFFNDKVIEYAAGICMHPDGKRLIVSYGFRDAEARLATFDAQELRKLLWFGSK